MCRDHHLQRGDRICGQATARILDDGDQSRGVGRPLRHDLAELGQMDAQGADRLRALLDQQLADAEDRRRPLRLFTLHGHETPRPSLCCATDRLGIGGIILLALYQGLDVRGRDKPHLIGKLAGLAPPTMRAATGFRRDNAGLHPTEIGQHLITSQFLA